MNKVATVVGSKGQDGKIAVDFLLKKGYRVVGIDKKDLDITNFKKVAQLIKKEQPDEIYHLAAFHHSSQDKRMDNIPLLKKSFQFNVLSLLNFLEAIRIFSPQSKLFYAGSSLIFGAAPTTIQNEQTPFNPDTMYGITKADGIFLCRMYRKQYNLFASTGILYNHESPFRGKQYLSSKVVTAALKIKAGKQKYLTLGDLKAQVDWGYAPDYIEAMHRILQLKSPDDFIIATGKKHSVLDFVKTTFGLLNLDWKQHIKEESQIITRKRKTLVGNARKLKLATGWQPKTSFKRMIKILIDAKR